MIYKLSISEEKKYKSELETILKYLTRVKSDYTKEICIHIKNKDVKLVRKMLRTLEFRQLITLVDEGNNWFKWYII